MRACVHAHAPDPTCCVPALRWPLVRSLRRTQVAEFVDRGVLIAAELKAKYPKMKDFREALVKDVPAPIATLKKEVEDFAMQFPTIGFEKASMKYKN